MTVDLRLAVPAAVGWIATAVLIGVSGVSVPALVVAWVLAGALVAVAIVRRRSWLAVAALAAAAIAVCCSSIALQSPGRQPTLLTEAAAAGRLVVATATTTQIDSTAAQFNHVRVGEDSVDGSIPVLVFGEAPSDRLGIGSVVELTGTLTEADAGDDVAFLFFTEKPPKSLAAPPWYLDWANDLRARFLTATQELPGEGGDLLVGLAIGDTSAVSDDLDAAMKSSSLSHLTAVSGANCAIVIGLIMTAGAAVGMPRWLRIAASVTVLLAFVVLVTPEPSVLRAAVMAALVLVALFGGRPVRGLPVLALATIVLLVIDPWLARNYGFVLSVLATAGLLLLAGPLAGALGRWLPRWLAVVIAVPVAAQLACQPVIILLDASIPTYGVAANLLAAPAAPVATVVGLAACVALALAPPLGVLLCHLAWLPSAWIAAVAQFFAAAPAARLPWPAGVAGVGLLVLLSTLAVLAVISRGSWRRWTALALAVGIVGYAGVVTGIRVGELAGRPGDWQIAACDVGQGDAFVVRSAGEVALIDTGPEPKPLRACLDDLGIGRIDLLVITHFHLDHYGGIPAILGQVDRVLVGPSSGPTDDRVVADLAAAGAAVHEVSRGPSGLLGELRWRVLWPPDRLAGIELGNESSVALEFQPVGDCLGGCLSSVFLGDLGQSAQDRLLATVALGQVDVVKVGHHGSADQSERLYARLHAVLGVIGVGADNGYGHPADPLLNLLDRVGTVAARTDQDGLILLGPGESPGTVSVWSER